MTGSLKEEVNVLAARPGVVILTPKVLIARDPRVLLAIESGENDGTCSVGMENGK